MEDRTYRLYEVGADGRIRGALSRSFADDAEALAEAGHLLTDVSAVEIWQTDRMVGRLDRYEPSQATA